MIPRNGLSVLGRVGANQRIEPMRGSVFRMALYSGVSGTLPLMAHPHR
jgi:hypothetical protein